MSLMNSLEGSGFGDISRRYIVLNGFDGILTVLGITVGAFSSSISSPAALVSSGMGTALGLMISGFTSAYFTEKAERKRDFKELRDQMVSGMGGSVHEKNVSRKSVYVASLNAISPFLTALVSTIPYILASFGVINLINTAYYVSATVSIVLLALFGAFLGKISRESVFVFALKMVGVGLITIAVIYLLGLGSL